jgi:predicted nucleic acid-binding protein
MIYIDTSAAIKLVRPEEHSAALSRWIDERPGIPVISSVLIEVELLRATRRSDPARKAHASDVLRGISVVTLSPAVIARAVGYPDPDLRSIDAIHLATAEHVASATSEAIEAFLAYDERLLAAAHKIGLAIAAPGTLGRGSGVGGR